MKTTTINLKLNTRSLDAAIRKLEAYQKHIENRVKALIEVMCLDGEEYAKAYLLHWGTGMTYGSIIGYREGNRGIIEAGENAIWIEFGTGVTKNIFGDPFHERGKLGVYTFGGYGMGHGADPYGWWYWKDNKWNHTYGIQMQPFMHNAAMKLKEDFEQTSKRVFNYGKG